MRILYIDIDSQRPDHLGCYGYHRATSPAIDQLAREGIVFDQVYTPDAPCLPSRTAFYSGRFGIQTGVVGHGGTAAQPKIQGPGRSFRDSFDDQGLGRQLQKLGYHTAMISPFGQRHAAWHFYAGFNEIHNTGDGGMESAEVVKPVVDKWLADNAGKDDWFLHINYWDPHTPYRAPEDYGDPFKDDPLPAWLNDDEVIARHRKMTGPHTMGEIGMYNDNESPEYPRHPGKITDKESLRRMIDGYDTGVKYVDDQVASIVAQLKAAGVYDDTVIIISADHGENLGELGIYGEHGTADAATCRIPLIIKWPDGPQGVRNSKLHYNLDLAPTLMDLLGGEKQPLWDGESYASALTDNANVGRDEVTISQCCHVCQRSIRWDKWLYMRTYHDGFHLSRRKCSTTSKPTHTSRTTLPSSIPSFAAKASGASPVGMMPRCRPWPLKGTMLSILSGPSSARVAPSTPASATTICPASPSSRDSKPIWSTSKLPVARTARMKSAAATPSKSPAWTRQAPRNPDPPRSRAFSV
ncbi:MAG: sulfatase-like hydrolase/transferase [Puniceicoccales bacterium]